jgi:hypothetical protein
MTDSELVAVSTFPSVVDAEIARGMLKEVGIQSIVRSDSPVMYPAIGGAELLVRVEDIERATEALAASEE